MKTLYKKLDIKYFHDVKSGKKPFEFRLNDCDYQVGDVVVFLAYAGKESAEEHCVDEGYVWTQHLFEEGYDVWENCDEELADTITVTITCMLSDLEVNEGLDFMDNNPKICLFEDNALTLMRIAFRKGWDYNYFRENLEDYFKANRLPSGYVTFGTKINKPSVSWA